MMSEMTKSVSRPAHAPDPAGRGDGVRVPLTMDDYVPYQLALLSSRLSRELEAVYGESPGLSRTEWRTLALVGEFGESAATAVVERSGMDAVAVHRAVKRLEETGLIQRVSSSADKRLKPLRLTPAGAASYQAIVPHALDLERRLLARLLPDEVRILRKVLAKLLS